MDLSKLTDEQLDIAEKLIAEAKRQGVNPDLLLPMVMQESGFKPGLVSKKGAIGVMQLMPDTAKSLNVDPNDVDQNIKGGVSFFKKLLANPLVQNDPFRAYIAYNAGPGAKYFQTGKIEDLPDETLAYVENIMKSSGTSKNEVNAGQPASPSVNLPVIPAPPASEASASSSSTDSGGTGQPQELNPVIGSIVGGPLGLSAGTMAAGVKAKKDAAEAAYDYAQAQRAASAARSATPAAAAAVDAAEAASLIPGEAQHTRAFEGTNKGSGVTGRASQTTYQLRTQQIAEQAKEQQRVLEQLRKARILGQQVPSLPGIVASTPAGVIAPAQAVQSMAAAPVAPVAAEGALPASQTSSFAKYLRALGALPVKAALGGAGAGFGAIDTLNRANRKEYGDASISALSTVAGLAAPYVASMGALPSAAVAGPLYLTASDRIKRLAKHPEEIELQEDAYDPMGNVQNSKVSGKDRPKKMDFKLPGFIERLLSEEPPYPRPAYYNPPPPSVPHGMK
jgi:hypothetical protein